MGRKRYAILHCEENGMRYGMGRNGEIRHEYVLFDTMEELEEEFERCDMSEEKDVVVEIEELGTNGKIRITCNVWYASTGTCSMTVSHVFFPVAISMFRSAIVENLRFGGLPIEDKPESRSMHAEVGAIGKISEGFLDVLRHGTFEQILDIGTVRAEATGNRRCYEDATGKVFHISHFRRGAVEKIVVKERYDGTGNEIVSILVQPTTLEITTEEIEEPSEEPRRKARHVTVGGSYDQHLSRGLVELLRYGTVEQILSIARNEYSPKLNARVLRIRDNGVVLDVQKDAKTTGIITLLESSPPPNRGRISVTVYDSPVYDSQVCLTVEEHVETDAAETIRILREENESMKELLALMSKAGYDLLSEIEQHLKDDRKGEKG